MLTFDDLSLICSADGRCWWQQKKEAKTHIAALFDRVEPKTGDWLIDPTADDFVVQELTIHGTQIVLGKRKIIHPPRSQEQKARGAPEYPYVVPKIDETVGPWLEEFTVGDYTVAGRAAQEPRRRRRGVNKKQSRKRLQSVL